MASTRIRAFAKINLTLEILNKRPDGFHNLRTVFQTISLADVIEIHAGPARSQTRIAVESNVEIPGVNLISRAAEHVLEATGKRAALRILLRKRIPMGGGLGGGSTDAAAVLLALPQLLGRTVAPERLADIAASLGSDVPFFLVGGTALGLGRGTELYPLADAPAPPVLLVSPGVHVSTAAAYSELQRTADTVAPINATERLVRAMDQGTPAAAWPCTNDFEHPVLSQHPEIAAARRKLKLLGARPAMMTGSGSAVFGLFNSRAERDSAAARFSGAEVFRVSFVSRRRYRAGRFGTGVL